MSAAPSSAARAAMTGGAEVEVKGLTWRPLGRREPILRDVTFTLAPGERVLLAGPSGAGKSTLLRALAGVLTLTEPGDLTGSVTVDGRDPHEGGSRVGLLVQDPADAVVAGRVGRDVAFGPENLGMARAQIWERVREALTAVGFPYGVDHPTGSLSGGETQRLALAGVLALRPGLLLLDEPTSMLDPASAGMVRDAIASVVRGAGATTVLVEHQVADWVDDVDRVIVLGRDGTVFDDGAIAKTMAVHSSSLAAQGVWVPGVPDPTPLLVPPDLFAPVVIRQTQSRPPDARGAAVRGTPRGARAIEARAVGVRRRARLGLALGRSRMPASTTLDNVYAEVCAGESLAVRGASGAGKSTLVGLLAGLEAPTSGEVLAGAGLAAGLDPVLATWSSRDLAARMGWVPQQAELAVVGRTVREDVLATVRALGRETPDALARAGGLLELLGLSSLAGANPHHLSGGEQRRLALACALAHGPGALILDEPTVGQDRHTWAAVAGVIDTARASGMAVAFASHDHRLAGLADRSLVLSGGRVVEGYQ